jgi:hypothetical protein
MSFKRIISIMLFTLLVSPVVLAEDAKVEGIATQDFSLIGGSGWEVDIDNVISGPPTLAGTTVSIGMATVSPTIPRGTVDTNIAVGDRVEAFGSLDAGLIKLYGSSDYYIKKISGNQILSSPSGKSETSANGASQFDSCVGNNGWQDAPDISLGEVYIGNFCPFSGGKMFKQIYRRFYVPNAGQITANVVKVPSNGIIMIWLQEMDDQSTFVSSPNIFDGQGILISQPTGQPVTLSANVARPAYWGIMIQCATLGGLQDSECSFVVSKGCDWTGRWNLDSSPSNQRIQMDLQQSGDMVTGSYSNQGQITGTVSDNKLQGTWAEPPDYSEPRNKGAFEFTLSADCTTFSGNWRLGSSGSWMGQWNGKRAKSAVREDAATSRGDYRGTPPDNTSPDYTPPDLWPV